MGWKRRRERGEGVLLLMNIIGFIIYINLKFTITKFNVDFSTGIIL
jgi:hypothetical protein